MNRLFDFRSVLVSACLPGLCVAASFQSALADPGPVGLAAFGERAVIGTIPVRVGLERFVIQDPAATLSPAWRLNTDLADKTGIVPEPTPGFRLHSRVIVKANDARLIEGALAHRLARPMLRAAPVRGYWFVEAGTIDEASVIAGELASTGLFPSVEFDIERPRVLRGGLPNDPMFPSQWHLRNTLIPIADVNAEGAWALGYTGAGITVGIVEGGFQSNHPDLWYHSQASQGGGSSSHATSVAGVVGAVGNNGIGVAGLAYACRVASLLYGSATQTASAFTHRNDLNAIKNNSWGPWDSGQLWDLYASSIEHDALEESVTLGRGGLGTIVCWAAGNGGPVDRVDYDPFTSSRYTFAIGAIGDLDVESSFNEQGSSMLVVSHTSGNTRFITSTRNGSGYTSTFGGTSSSSPLTAGAIALALEANPALTWRDVQSLLVHTARKNDPGNPGWITNAAGYQVNYRYGFGAVDAEALVLAAQTWTPIEPEVSTTSGLIAVNEALPDNDPIGLTRTFEIAENIVIESVVLTMNTLTSYVGDLRLVMTGPSGTESIFAEPRGVDSSNDISNYSFMSLRHWGESSAGTWTVKLSDERPGSIATWLDFTLTIHGTEPDPDCGPADLAPPFGVLDLADVTAFVFAFMNGEAAADLAEPFGVLDLADVIAFSVLFGAGCP